MCDCEARSGEAVAPGEGVAGSLAPCDSVAVAAALQDKAFFYPRTSIHLRKQN